MSVETVKAKEEFRDSLWISEEHPHFEGHFPSLPVLPAVSQLDIVLLKAREHWGRDLRCLEVKRAKYRSLIKPSTQVDLSLTLSDGLELSWVLRDEKQIYSSGDLKLRRALDL